MESCESGPCAASCWVWSRWVIVDQEAGVLASWRAVRVSDSCRLTSGCRHEPSEDVPLPGRDRVGSVVITPRPSRLLSRGATRVQRVSCRSQWTDSG